MGFLISVRINYRICLSNLKNIFVDDESESEVVRKEHIWDFLKDKVIILRPSVKLDRDKIFYKGNSPILIKKNPGFDANVPHLVMIPVFSVNNTNLNISNKNDFETSLRNQKSIGILNQPWSHEKDDIPDAIIWNSGEQLTLYGGISEQSVSYSGMSFRFEDDEIKRIEIKSNNDIWYSQQYTTEDMDILFIDKATLLGLNKGEESLSEINDENKGPQKAVEEMKKETEFEEVDLIQKLKYIVSKKHLYYRDEDLVNFHTAMKSDGLVILSGLSGTGKSQLVQAYSEALGLPSTNIDFIPVRPYWADDSDLIGYADTVNSVYRPGDSGLVDILVNAEKNQNQLYVIVFDEMNLARVEHYFSQFLSILEMKSESRSIQLYNDELEARMYNKENYPASISIKNNILFVGTINTDESTFQLSDKVLDRSNVIRLNMVPFYENAHEDSNQKSESTNMHDKKQRVSLDKYEQFKKVSLNKKLTRDEKTMLWKIQECLSSVDRNIGIGWRIVTQIDDYLSNLPQIESVDRTVALDMQLEQRVWTKIRGSEEQLRGLLGSNEGTVFEKGKLEQILDEYSNSSDFEKSREMLRNKAKDLKLYGFTV
ncbi:McrB family protein [Levilactobacillus brevis]|uniref:McrB family protein n=1 Tax=Levilactobacillus brevis TaxID=1580 RepID=UPI00339CF48E